MIEFEVGKAYTGGFGFGAQIIIVEGRTKKFIKTSTSKLKIRVIDDCEYVRFEGYPFTVNIFADRSNDKTQDTNPS